MISLDTRLLSYPYWSGVEHYTYNIALQMVDLYPEETFRLHFDSVFEDARVADLLGRPNVSQVVRTGSAKFWGALPLDLLRAKSAVFYAMGGRLQYYRPPVPLSAIMIHDCAPITNPRLFAPDEAASIAEKFRRSIPRCDIIMVNSEVTRQEVQECFGTPAERIIVAPPAVAPPRDADVAPTRPANLAPNADYVLMVNPGRVNKNWENMLLAFDRMLTRRNIQDNSLLLVAAGRLGDQETAFQSCVAEKIVHKQAIVPLGYVSDSELTYLYKNARAMAFVSSYEGFGMPALEAMHYGVPLVVSSIPVLREVTGDAALHAAHDDPDAISGALERVCFEEDLRQMLIQRGLQRAEHTFTWQKSARTTMEAFRAFGKR